jgi:hypothetical protein
MTAVDIPAASGYVMTVGGLVSVQVRLGVGLRRHGRTTLGLDVRGGFKGMTDAHVLGMQGFPSTGENVV